MEASFVSTAGVLGDVAAFLVAAQGISGDNLILGEHLLFWRSRRGTEGYLGANHQFGKPGARCICLGL